MRLQVTALGDPALLERVSSSVVALRSFYARLEGGRGELTRSQFVEGWLEAFDTTAEEAGEVRPQPPRTTTPRHHCAPHCHRRAPPLRAAPSRRRL